MHKYNNEWKSKIIDEILLLLCYAFEGSIPTKYGLDFYSHITINNMSYKTIMVDIINLQGINNIFSTNIHPFRTL